MNWDVTTIGNMPAAPASGATKTVFNSYTDASLTNFRIYELFAKLVFTNKSSHDSASNGVKIEFSDDGSTWAAADGFPVTYTAATDLLMTYEILLVAKRYVRITWENSANTLTTWMPGLQGICQRAAAV